MTDLDIINHHWLIEASEKFRGPDEIVAADELTSTDVVLYWNMIKFYQDHSQY